MTARVRVIRRQADRPHQCPLPGWLTRWRLHLHVGAVVQCLGCGSRWELWGDGWHRYTDLDNLPQPTDTGPLSPAPVWTHDDPRQV